MGHDDGAGKGLLVAQPEAAARPTRVRYLVLTAACSLAVLTYVQRQGFVAGTPYLQRDLGLNDEQMGYLLSGWLLAYGAFQVPGGLLGDRLGARRLLTALVLAWSVVLGSVALIAVLPGGGWVPFALLLVLRFLFGSFQAGGFPGLARVVADWVPTPRRGFAQGLLWTCSRVGGFVAPLLVGLWLFKVYHGWPIPFVILAGLGLLWCAGFWPWFRNRPAEMKGVNAAERALIEAGRPVVARPAPLSWSCFLGSVNVWALCLMYGFVGFSGNFITNWLPSYLKGHRSLTDEQTAWLTGLPLAFGAVSCVLGGTLSDWINRRTGSRNLGRRVVGCTSLLCAALTILASVWVHDVWLLALAFSLAFFFNDAVMGPAWASCADIGERHAGALSGAMNMTGAFLGAAAMSFAGLLFQRHLDEVVFIVFACSYALGALCWLAVDVTRPLVAKDTAAVD
ncbi:MAG TPA: MFS transporter [Gemmataceae bacterium]|nr:MFS transporter [Gemmataceae bacterium]